MNINDLEYLEHSSLVYAIQGGRSNFIFARARARAIGQYTASVTYVGVYSFSFEKNLSS